MTIQEVLLPLFLEVILTFALLFWLAPLRGRDFSLHATGQRQYTWLSHDTEIETLLVMVG